MKTLHPTDMSVKKENICSFNSKTSFKEIKLAEVTKDSELPTQSMQSGREMENKKSFR